MFLDYNKKYLSSLLSEAPEDQTGEQQTQMSTDDNATYEPQEQDASMGTEDSMGEEELDEGLEGGDDMGGEDGAMDDMGGGAPAGGDMGGAVNTKDIFKKRKLFKDYKDLLEALENIMDVSSHMLSKNLPDDAKKVYRFINGKMEENREKLKIVLTEQYFNLSYQQLLTIFMYIKMATKLYADMIKKLNDLYHDKD